MELRIGYRLDALCYFFVHLIRFCYIVFVFFLNCLSMNDNLKCLGWNYKGDSSIDKLNQIIHIIRDLQLYLVALVETLADENRVS